MRLTVAAWGLSWGSRSTNSPSRSSSRSPSNMPRSTRRSYSTRRQRRVSPYGSITGDIAIRVATRRASRQRRWIDTGSLLGEPDRVELAVQEVTRGHRVAVDLAVVGHDAVPLQRVDVVHLLVVEPLLEGAQDLLALLGIGGPRLLDVQIVHHRVLVLAEVDR